MTREDKDKITTSTVTLTLPERTYNTAFAISVLLRYERFEDYISDLIRGDVQMHLDRASNELNNKQIDGIKNKLGR